MDERPIVTFTLSAYFYPDTGWSRITSNVLYYEDVFGQAPSHSHHWKQLEVSYDEDHRAIARGLFEEGLRNWQQVGYRLTAF